MVLRFECSDCGREYRVKDENVGKRFKCKDCGKVLVVPDGQFDDYGDDYGSGESSLPPRTGKSRKSSSRPRRKQGIPTGVKIAIFSIVGVVALGLLGWGVVTLSGKLSSDTHESLYREVVDLSNDMADILEDVEDKESAEAAGPKIEALGDRMAEILERQIELKKKGPLSREEEDRLNRKFSEALLDAQLRATNQVTRLRGIPEVMAALRDPMMKLDKKINDTKSKQRKTE